MKWLLPIVSFVAIAPEIASPQSPPGSARAVLLDILRGPCAAFSGIQRSTVYLDAGKTAQSEVTISGDGRVSVRREYTSGITAGVVMLQRNGVIWQRDRRGTWVRLASGNSLAPAAAADLLRANYTVAIGGPEMLAGRKVVRVELRPRDACRPSRAVWLDRDAQLILKDELRGPGGALRSVSEFVSVTMSPQPRDRFTPPSHAEPPTGLYGPASFTPQPTASEVERRSGRPVPVPRHLPGGFRVLQYGVMTTGSGRTMPAVRYTDGLASFTIFERGLGAAMGGGRGMRSGRGRMQSPGPGMPGQSPGPPPGRRGQCLSAVDKRQQAVVDWLGRDCDYLLVGDITAEELRRIAQSLP